jgi:hypothetical protein
MISFCHGIFHRTVLSQPLFPRSPLQKSYLLPWFNHVVWRRKGVHSRDLERPFFNHQRNVWHNAESYRWMGSP